MGWREQTEITGSTRNLLSGNTQLEKWSRPLINLISESLWRVRSPRSSLWQISFQLYDIIATLTIPDCTRCDPPIRSCSAPPHAVGTGSSANPDSFTQRSLRLMASFMFVKGLADIAQRVSVFWVCNLTVASSQRPQGCLSLFNEAITLSVKNLWNGDGEWFGYLSYI